jgi:hypothetical protein
VASLIADLLIEESKRTNLERVQARGEFSSDQITVYEERLESRRTPISGTRSR